jgi:hypothetical protein
MHVMKRLKDLYLRQLDRLFKTATDDAALEAKRHDLPRAGIDRHGELQAAPKPEDPPDVSSGNIVA